jgi:hypothetical protein
MKKKPLHIKRLISGGLITNYFCTSQCRHCLYACSPRWPKTYIDKDIARECLTAIRRCGCVSIHIGGGEPFLNPNGLKAVMQTARETGIRVEYIETNSSWYRGEAEAVDLLTNLADLGLSTLLVSISPFHNEYIPFYKVKGVMAACRTAGIQIFPWVADFIRDIDSFDDRCIHGLGEYRDAFGDDYLHRIPGRYWIHFGGRALSAFSEILPKRSIEDVLGTSTGGCTELADVSHFHVDLFGNYIPGLCSGLSLSVEDLGKAVTAGQYPILHVLATDGILGLLMLAAERFGYDSRPHYVSKCDLCLDIRKHLVINRDVDSPDLWPRGFYENI